MRKMGDISSAMQFTRIDTKQLLCLGNHGYNITDTYNPQFG